MSNKKVAIAMILALVLTFSAITALLTESAAALGSARVTSQAQELAEAELVVRGMT